MNSANNKNHNYEINNNIKKNWTNKCPQNNFGLTSSSLASLFVIFQYSMKIVEEIQRNEEKKFLSDKDDINDQRNNAKDDVDAELNTDKDDDITLQE